MQTLTGRKQQFDVEPTTTVRDGVVAIFFTCTNSLRAAGSRAQGRAARERGHRKQADSPRLWRQEDVSSRGFSCVTAVVAGLDPPAFHATICCRNNDDTLSTYEVKAGTVINMVLALRGGL